MANQKIGLFYGQMLEHAEWIKHEAEAQNIDVYLLNEPIEKPEELDEYNGFMFMAYATETNLIRTFSHISFIVNQLEIPFIWAVDKNKNQLAYRSFHNFEELGDVTFFLNALFDLSQEQLPQKPKKVKNILQLLKKDKTAEQTSMPEPSQQEEELPLFEELEALPPLEDLENSRDEGRNSRQQNPYQKPIQEQDFEQMGEESFGEESFEEESFDQGLEEETFEEETFEESYQEEPYQTVNIVYPAFSDKDVPVEPTEEFYPPYAVQEPPVQRSQQTGRGVQPTRINNGNQQRPVPNQNGRQTAPLAPNQQGVRTQVNRQVNPINQSRQQQTVNAPKQQSMPQQASQQPRRVPQQQKRTVVTQQRQVNPSVFDEPLEPLTPMPSHSPQRQNQQRDGFGFESQFEEQPKSFEEDSFSIFGNNPSSSYSFEPMEDRLEEEEEQITVKSLPNVIAVAGVGHGVGTSFVALNLAYALQGILVEGKKTGTLAEWLGREKIVEREAYFMGETGDISKSPVVASKELKTNQEIKALWVRAKNQIFVVDCEKDSIVWKLAEHKVLVVSADPQYASYDIPPKTKWILNKMPKDFPIEPHKMLNYTPDLVIYENAREVQLSLWGQIPFLAKQNQAMKDKWVALIETLPLKDNDNENEEEMEWTLERRL